jgi:CheY-like chemotaxis protein
MASTANESNVKPTQEHEVALLGRGCALLLSEMQAQIAELRAAANSCLNTRPNTTTIDIALSCTYEATTRLGHLISVLALLHDGAQQTDGPRTGLRPMLRAIVGTRAIVINIDQDLKGRMNSNTYRRVAVALVIHAATASVGPGASFVFTLTTTDKADHAMTLVTEVDHTAPDWSSIPTAPALAAIVKAAGGTCLESCSDTTYSCSVTLPAHRTTETDLKRTNRASAVRQSQIVLFIEDDPLLRTAVSSWLIKLGHNVIDAEDTDQALALFDAHESSIDVIVQDLILPGSIDGEVLLQTLVGRNPAIPVIVASGTIDTVTAEHILALGATAYLNKPYKLDQLMALVEGT